jgi:hypothetical protein
MAAAKAPILRPGTTQNLMLRSLRTFSTTLSHRTARRLFHAAEMKYRLAAADASHGNYSFSASLGSASPTGSYKNGSSDAAVVPTFYAGKGFGRFDVQSTLGARLPVADIAKLGRVMGWNTVAQYHVGKYFWPEIEDDASLLHAGPNDGRIQNFVTPGLIVSKVSFSRDSQSRNALVF